MDLSPDRAGTCQGEGGAKELKISDYRLQIEEQDLCQSEICNLKSENCKDPVRRLTVGCTLAPGSNGPKAKPVKAFRPPPAESRG